MSKKTYYDNYRVEVEPVSEWFPGGTTEEHINKEYKKTCERIVEDIKRHVDNVGGVSIVFDTNHVCGYCGKIWTEESTQFNGGCCDEDMKHEPEPTND